MLSNYQLKALRALCKTVATELAILLQEGYVLQRDAVRSPSYPPSLHGNKGRKYLNAVERRHFAAVAETRPPETRLFCLLLMWTGCRISEALSLTAANIDLDASAVFFETLKRRRDVARQVPVPPPLLEELNRHFEVRSKQEEGRLARQRLWRWSRSTAWRRVKATMQIAGLRGNAAMPKGLRHTFGVASFQNVPPHLVQRWLGHASLRTTAIYGDVSGPEERAFAERVWREW